LEHNFYAFTDKQAKGVFVSWKKLGNESIRRYIKEKSLFFKFEEAFKRIRKPDDRSSY
jgi:hypothetical protein